MAAKENKKIYLTLLSVISAIAVVTLHTNGCFWRFSYERYWFTANIIESVMYFAVPVFFMISGATLLDYSDRYSTKIYFKKRIQKTVIPFVIWSLIGILYRILTHAISIDDLLSVSYLVEKIINIAIIDIYWFFIPLFVVYLTLPVLSAVSKEKRTDVYKYLVIVCLLLNYLIPFISDFIDFQYNSNLMMNIGGNYIVYICTGYLLDRTDLNKKNRVIIYLLGLTGLLMMIIGTYILSTKSGSIISTFKGYQNLPCYLYSVSIFIFFKSVSKRITNIKYINIIDWLSSYTFPLYLTHWFIITLIVKIFSINTLSIIYRLFAPALIFAINVFITYIVRKLPFGKHVLP